MTAERIRTTGGTLAIKGAWLLAALLPTVASAESLMDAYKLARDSDPKYRAVTAETRAVGTAIDQARAGFLPFVKYDMEQWESRQRVISSKNPIFGAGVTNFPTDNRTLSLTQPLFRMDVIERFAQAKSIVKQAEYTLLAAEQDLQLRTERPIWWCLPRRTTWPMPRPSARRSPRCSSTRASA